MFVALGGAAFLCYWNDPNRHQPRGRGRTVLPDADVVIVGSGMGGATVAAALAPSGRRILILERGERLSDTPEARDAEAIFARGHFRPDETWLTPEGERFNPGNYACVGGNTKFYGAVLMRYRAEDFAPRSHMGGESPGWPLSYDEIEPWYQKAETLYRVRGASGDRTRPSPAFRRLPLPPGARRARDRGPASPAFGRRPAPRASAARRRHRRGWPARATPWDAFPDTTGAKMDAESVGLAEALKHPNVELRPASRWSGWSWTMTGASSCLLTTAGGSRPIRSCLPPARCTRRSSCSAPRRSLSERSCQPVRPGRAQLHEPQLFGAAGACRRGATGPSIRRRCI
jgi:hypothetical protein